MILHYLFVFALIIFILSQHIYTRSYLEKYQKSNLILVINPHKQDMFSHKQTAPTVLIILLLSYSEDRGLQLSEEIKSVIKFVLLFIVYRLFTDALMHPK